MLWWDSSFRSWEMMKSRVTMKFSNKGAKCKINDDILICDIDSGLGKLVGKVPHYGNPVMHVFQIIFHHQEKLLF